MINYNYLSCTDSDGNIKEINFCPDALPETASQEVAYLTVHPDTENPNLLHVQKADGPYWNTISLSIRDISPSIGAGITVKNIHIDFSFPSKIASPALEESADIFPWIIKQLGSETVALTATGLVEFVQDTETKYGLAQHIKILGDTKRTPNSIQISFGQKPSVTYEPVYYFRDLVAASDQQIRISLYTHKIN